MNSAVPGFILIVRQTRASPSWREERIEPIYGRERQGPDVERE